MTWSMGFAIKNFSTKGREERQISEKHGGNIDGYYTADELWMEVRDIVQETGIKTIPMEKNCKKAK